MAQPETPDTRTRIRRQTPLHVDARIQQDIEANVRQYADRPGDISKRLAALDKEWNIERLVAGTTSVLMLATIALAAAVDGRWLWLTILFAVFLLQHAILGWSPQTQILRHWRVRTSEEIERERTGLKALRGDFANIQKKSDKAAAALQAAQSREQSPN